MWAMMMPRSPSRWIILTGVIAVGYVVIDLLSNRTPIDVFMTYATFSPSNAYWRKMIFDWGILNVWANPFFGIGLNDWFRPWYMFSNSVDNFWLLTAMRYGIPGFLLLALGVFLPICSIASRKIEKTSLNWQFRRAWIFTFVGLVLTLCTVDVWASANSYVAFLFGSGMWFLSLNKTTNLTAKEERLIANNLRTAPFLDQSIAAGPDPERNAVNESAKVASTSRYTRFTSNQTRK